MAPRPEINFPVTAPTSAPVHSFCCRLPGLLAVAAEHTKHLPQGHCLCGALCPGICITHTLFHSSLCSWAKRGDRENVMKGQQEAVPTLGPEGQGCDSQNWARPVVEDRGHCPSVASKTGRPGTTYRPLPLPTLQRPLRCSLLTRVAEPDARRGVAIRPSGAIPQEGLAADGPARARGSLLPCRGLRAAPTQLEVPLPRSWNEKAPFCSPLLTPAASHFTHV